MSAILDPLLFFTQSGEGKHFVFPSVSCRFPCPRTRTGELVDHLPVKGRNIIGLAARDEVPVDHDLLIYPLRADIPEISLQRRP